MSRDLADRLEWVLLHRKERVRSASAWALMAGLTRSHVRITIRRGSSMSGESLANLARVAGVSLRWLITGDGSPDDPDRVQDDDPFGPRRIAIASARREAFVSETAIGQVQALAGEQFRFWTAPQWSELLLKLTIADARHDEKAFHALIAAAKEQRAESAAAPPVDEGVPPKAHAG